MVLITNNFFNLMSINSNSSYLFFLKDSGVNSFLQNSPNKYYKVANNDISPDSDCLPNIQNIESLNQLERFIKISNNCPLKNQALKTVFADGNPSSKIMLIGEAPGAEEDKLGKPFVGAAGQLLNKMLAAIKLDRNSVYITNIVPWRPPNNRAPNSEEIMQCLPFIQKHIEIIQPSILILLGGTATKAILTTTHGITKLRGQWHEYNNLYIKKPIPTIAMYHPAFLLRSPGHKKEAWRDLQKIQKKLKLISNENI